MGRKRSDEPKVKVTIEVPQKLHSDLKAIGVNMTQLFKDAAKKILEK